ncbi:hypothetical protein L1887_14053 [Cichorium endivia]|nr:hypothetical protein L1887_14053 [Cichorium endivia]
MLSWNKPFIQKFHQKKGEINMKWVSMEILTKMNHGEGPSKGKGSYKPFIALYQQRDKDDYMLYVAVLPARK